MLYNIYVNTFILVPYKVYIAQNFIITETPIFRLKCQGSQPENPNLLLLVCWLI